MGGMGVSLVRLSLTAAVLLAIWPFHAKKTVPPPPLTIEQEDERRAAGRCEKEGDMWFFMGMDNEIGFSSVSCGKAYRQWTHTQTPPPKVSRV